MDDFRLIIEAAVAKAKSDANIKKYVKDIQDQIGKLNLDVKVSDKNVKSAIKQITSETGKLNNSIEITKIKADSAQKSMNTFLQSLKPSYIKSNTQSIKELNNAFDQVKQTGNKADYSKATASLQNFKNTAKSAGAETATLTQVIKDNIGAFTNWYLIGGAVSGLIGNFKEAIATIKEVDTLLTEISKTSNLSGDALKQLGIDAYDSASKYGNTIQSYLSGYLEMSRGTDTNTAKGLAELSILAQSAGDMTAELANSYIVATNAAFKLENNVSKLNEILDGQNQITNRNQVSMSDLAMATSVAGSQAAESGVAVNQMTAAMGTMIASTKQGGEVAGRAFKGILMNLQQVSGEIDGEVFDTDSFKKVEAALNDVGVATEVIVNGTARLRDPIETLKELASVYNSLPNDSVEKANIIANLGGKYRGNQLAALLSNWKTYEKMLSDYQNSAGSAEAEAIKTANSVEGRLNKLSNTWNKTVANVVDSDMLKTFISIGTGAIELTDDLDVLQTALIGLGGFGSYKALTSLVPMLKNAMSSTLAFGNALNTVKASNFVADTANLTKAIQGLTLTQATAVLSTKSLDAATIEATMTQAGFSVAEAKTTASTLTMSTANGVATASTLGLGASFKALTAAMMANPVGLIIAGVTVAISALSFGLNKYKEAQEEALATSKELTQTYKDEQSSIDEQILKYKELQKQLEQGNLSTEETTSIKSQLLDIQGNLTSSFGDEASGIDLVNGKYKDQIGLLSELSKQKAQDYLSENRSGFETAKTKLRESNTYNLGMIGSNKGDTSLIDYLKQYNNDSVKLREYSANGITSYYVDVKGAVEEADNALHQLYIDVENVGKNTGVNVSSVLTSISSQLNKTWTDDLKAYKDTYDEYIKAQVVENDTLRPLYIQSIDAIDAYNAALSNGNGINEAKANLDSIKTKVNQNTTAVEGSQSVFDNLFSAVSSDIQVFSDTATDAKDSISNIFLNETASKAIDTFQKNIKTISDALSDTSSLSSSDLIDLMQEFADFDWARYGVSGASGVGDLKGALNALSISLRSSLDDTLQFNPALQKFYEETMNASEGVDDFSESISSSEQKSEEFYNAVLDGLSDTIKTQAESYNIDFANYKSLIEAKQALDEEYARQQQALVNAQMNFQNVMYSGDVERIKQLGIAYIDTQKSFNDYFKLTTDFSVSVDSTNKTYKKDPKDLAEKAAREAEEKRQKAIQEVKDKFAKEDNTNKFLLDTGKMTESIYYEKLQALNKKYFEGKSDFLEEDRQNQVAYYKWDKEQAEKSIKEKLKLTSEATDRILSLYDRSQSQSKNIGDSYTDGSDEQIKAYSDGLASVNQEISYINKQIAKLNKMKVDGLFKDNEDEYVSQLKTLQDALYDTTSAAKTFTDAIAESVKAQQDDITDAFDKAFETEKKNLENLKDSYDDIIDAQKEILDLKEKQRDYENAIAKQTKEISQIESRMAELQLAANSGDRQASAELRKLDEERAKKKDELAEDQHDHEVDLQQTALDKAKDDYDKLHEDKMTALEAEHKKQIDDINDIYNNMIILIKNSANMLDTEFGTKLQGYLSQLNSFGIVPSDEFVNGIKSGQAQLNTKEQALSILQNGNGAGKGTSELNSYVKSNFGGKQLSYEQMAQLASVLGFGGVTAENIKSDTITKNMILEALKRLFSNSTFATRGIVKAGSSSGSGLLSDLLKSLGEDKFIAVKDREGLMNQEETKVFKYDFIPTMNKFMTAFKPTLPDMSSIVTNNNSPNIQVTIPIAGNADAKTVSALNSSANNLAQQVAKAIIDIKRTK